MHPHGYYDPYRTHTHLWWSYFPSAVYEYEKQPWYSELKELAKRWDLDPVELAQWIIDGEYERVMERVWEATRSQDAVRDFADFFFRRFHWYPPKLFMAKVGIGRMPEYTPTEEERMFLESVADMIMRGQLTKEEIVDMMRRGQLTPDQYRWLVFNEFIPPEWEPDIEKALGMNIPWFKIVRPITIPKFRRITEYVPPPPPPKPPERPPEERPPAPPPPPPPKPVAPPPPPEIPEAPLVRELINSLPRLEGECLKALEWMRDKVRGLDRLEGYYELSKSSPDHFLDYLKVPGRVRDFAEREGIKDRLSKALGCVLVLANAISVGYPVPEDVGSLVDRVGEVIKLPILVERIRVLPRVRVAPARPPVPRKLPLAEAYRIGSGKAMEAFRLLKRSPVYNDLLQSVASRFYGRPEALEGLRSKLSELIDRARKGEISLDELREVLSTSDMRSIIGMIRARMYMANIVPPTIREMGPASYFAWLVLAKHVLDDATILLRRVPVVTAPPAPRVAPAPVYAPPARVPPVTHEVREEEGRLVIKVKFNIDGRVRGRYDVYPSFMNVSVTWPVYYFYYVPLPRAVRRQLASMYDEEKKELTVILE